ncbi:hypothetical protein HPGCJGGD_3339 [Methylobacterium haplocladii]|nr:hypothetical protein HPGCJGGD_3339 [Methylobacterium haplocladii]
MDGGSAAILATTMVLGAAFVATVLWIAPIV